MRIALILLALLTSGSAAAAPPQRIEERLTPAQMQATGLDQLTPAQLALLNALLADAPAAAPAPTAATTPADVAPNPPVAPPAAPAADNATTPATPNFVGYSDVAFADRVVGTVGGWEPGSEFELANGQRWKVLKGSVRLPTPRQDPPVRLIPGAAGRWFLQLDENLPSARVYRIR